MYIRKYGVQEEQAQAHLTIPENYTGNVFAHTNETQAEKDAPPPPSFNEPLVATKAEAGTEVPPSPKVAEILPVLLSVLLSDENEDLSTVLLFLLLL